METGIRPASELARADDLRYWAFVASLVGGVLIVASSLTMLALGPLWMGGMTGGMMGGYWDATDSGAWTAWAWTMGAWGLVTGAVVLAGAWRLRVAPEQSLGAGVAILVAGALSFPAMGGFGLGALASVVGGALAIAAARPRPRFEGARG